MTGAAALALSGVPTGRSATVAPPDVAAAPAPRCTPTAARRCVPVREQGPQAVAALLAASDRRGLGIAPAAAIVGPGKARALRARMLGRLQGTRLKTQASRRVRVSHAAPGGELRDTVSERGTARRGAASVVWFSRFDGRIERCPDPMPRANSHGFAPVTVDARYLIQTREVRRNGAVVETDISLTLDFRGSAYSTRRAQLDRIGPGRPPSAAPPGAGAPPASPGGPQPDLVVTRDVRVIPRPGVERDLGRQRATFDVGVVWPSASLTVPDTFGQFIRGMEGQEAAEPGPDADGPILGPAWRQLATAFLQQASQRMARLGRAAERHWRTPGACVALNLDGPATVLPGGRVELRGVPRSTARPVSADDLLGDFLGSAGFEAEVVRGAQLRSLITALPIPPGRNWLEYTAPAQAWTAAAKPGAKVTFLSKAGIGEATKLFDPASVSRIAGTFSGTFTGPNVNGAGVITFTGTFAFDRVGPGTGGDEVYQLTGGGYTLRFSGGDISGATACQMSGAGSFPLRAPAASGTLTVTRAADPAAPWTYRFHVLPAVTDRVTVTRSACPMGAGEGTTVELGTFSPWSTNKEYPSPDGVTYAGSEDQTFMGNGQVITWSLTGSG